ncbi:MAG: AMP-binding protein [Rhodoplanes sp.]
MLSHANLLANIRAVGAVLRASSDDVFVSWLPLYHDFGLITGWFGCLYFGAQFYVMSPLAFLARPENWLWAIQQFRSTITGAPNFAFGRLRIAKCPYRSFQREMGKMVLHVKEKAWNSAILCRSLLTLIVARQAREQMLPCIKSRPAGIQVRAGGQSAQPLRHRLGRR